MRTIDGGVLIAFFRSKDELHARAVGLLKEYSDEALLCTTGVLQEIAEYLLRHDGAHAAFKAAYDILNSNNILIQAPSKEQLSQAAELMKKHAGLSYCDSQTIVVSGERELKQIISFDSDFDAFKQFRRLC